MSTQHVKIITLLVALIALPGALIFAGPTPKNLEALKDLKARVDGAKAVSQPSVQPLDMQQVLAAAHASIPGIKDKVASIIVQFLRTKHKDQSELMAGVGLMSDAIKRAIVMGYREEAQKRGLPVNSQFTPEQLRLINVDSELVALQNDIQKNAVQAIQQKMQELVSQDQESSEEESGGADQPADTAKVSRLTPEQKRGAIDEAIAASVEEIKASAGEQIADFRKAQFVNELALVAGGEHLIRNVMTIRKTVIVKEFGKRGIEEIDGDDSAYIDHQLVYVRLNQGLIASAEEAVQYTFHQLENRKQAKALQREMGKPRSTWQKLGETNWAIPGL